MNDQHLSEPAEPAEIQAAPPIQEDPPEFSDSECHCGSNLSNEAKMLSVFHCTCGDGTGACDGCGKEHCCLLGQCGELEMCNPNAWVDEARGMHQSA